MVSVVGLILVAGVLAGCAATTADWVHPDAQGQAQLRQRTADLSECRTLARERYPDPAGPAPVTILNRPDGPLSLGPRGTDAYRDSPSRYVIERGKRVRQRRDFLETCMSQRGWQPRARE